MTTHSHVNLKCGLLPLPVIVARGATLGETKGLVVRCTAPSKIYGAIQCIAFALINQAPGELVTQ